MSFLPNLCTSSHVLSKHPACVLWSILSLGKLAIKELNTVITCHWRISDTPALYQDNIWQKSERKPTFFNILFCLWKNSTLISPHTGKGWGNSKYIYLSSRLEGPEGEVNIFTFSWYTTNWGSAWQNKASLQKKCLRVSKSTILVLKSVMRDEILKVK